MPERFSMMSGQPVPAEFADDRVACESWLSVECERILAYHGARIVTPWVFSWHQVTQFEYEMHKAALLPYDVLPAYAVGDWRIHGYCEAERAGFNYAEQESAKAPDTPGTEDDGGPEAGSGS